MSEMYHAAQEGVIRTETEHTGKIHVGCDVVFNLYLNEIENLKSSVRSLKITYGMFFVVDILQFPSNLSSLTSQNVGFLFQYLYKINILLDSVVKIHRICLVLKGQLQKKATSRSLRISICITT